MRLRAAGSSGKCRHPGQGTPRSVRKMKGSAGMPKTEVMDRDASSLTRRYVAHSAEVSMRQRFKACLGRFVEHRFKR